MKLRTLSFSIILVLLLFVSPCSSAQDDYFVHDIGMLWNRVSNYGVFGDESYFRADPICTWPRSSENSYLYKSDLYISGYIGSGLKIISTFNNSFIPLDSIHVSKSGFKADQETYTIYRDDPDFLGLFIKERTYAWKNALADDFIITEYTIINNPEKNRDIFDLTYSIMMDADVSQCKGWAPEGFLVNEDDLALSNADYSFLISDAIDTIYNGAYDGWDWVKLVPYMRRQIERAPNLIDSLNTFPLDSRMTFMWDGDNPNYTAEDIGIDTSLLPETVDREYIDDDTGNPGADGHFNSAGFMGWRMLKSTPLLRPKSFVPLGPHDSPIYYNIWNQFYDFTEAINLQYAQWNNGKLNPADYRTMTTYGPLDTLKSGDSVVVTIAYGVGCDPIKGGVYSLLELNKIMQIAQYIVDHDYQVDFTQMYDPQIMTISIGDGINEIDLSFGWSAQSTDEFDNGIDEYAPIEPAAGSFDARFHHQNEDYIVDLRYPPLGESMIWELSFNPATGKDTVSLEWDRTLLPEQGSFLLQDTLTGNIVDIDMRQTNHFACNFSDLKYLRIVYNINVNVDNEIDIPVKYILDQNYPNPFNLITTISYQLPAVSDVELMIFDISGRKINQWSYTNQATGTYEITWNGKDQSGNSLSSGVYIYRMVAGEFIESKKMVLLK